MATVTPAEGMNGEPFDVPDTNTMLLAYYRGEGYVITLGDDAEAFDPGAHSVPEVEAYLAELDLDEEAGVAEYRRVIESERQGKGRKTVLALELAE